MAVERLANLGYAALKKEVTRAVPVTPNVFVPLYKETLMTDMHLDEDNPIMGVRSFPYNDFVGMRSHDGQITVLAEPNTAEFFLDMMLTAGSITGAGPYTHPFTEGLANSYTLDLAKGQVVHRYWGVEAEMIEPTFDKDKMQFNIDVSARGSFLSRKIASVTTTSITFDTTYDPSPTTGLVIGDLVRCMSATTPSTTADFTVSSITNGTTVVVNSTAAAYIAGDYFFLRPQTPSYTILSPFLWGRTQFQFGATAAAAFSAAQTNCETGSKWKIMHKFENKGGSERSGSFDPSALVRTQTDAEVTIKRFFDIPDDLMNYLNVTNQALVVRHFSGANYEMRLTFNNMFQKGNKRHLDTGKIIYYENDWNPTYSTGDGQMFDVKILNNLAT